MNDHNLSVMLPYWTKLSETQRKVMVSFYERVQFVFFSSLTHMHAAAQAGNTEAVCKYLGDDLAELYRQG